MRSRPVSALVTVTVAPGTAAPDVSRTLPTRLPYNTWADADAAMASSARVTLRTLRHLTTVRSSELFTGYLLNNRLIGTRPVTRGVPGRSCTCQERGQRKSSENPRKEPEKFDCLDSVQMRNPTTWTSVPR